MKPSGPRMRAKRSPFPMTGAENYCGVPEGVALTAGIVVKGLSDDDMSTSWVVSLWDGSTDGFRASLGGLTLLESLK